MEGILRQREAGEAWTDGSHASQRPIRRSNGKLGYSTRFVKQESVVSNMTEATLLTRGR
jgi:hypothetical protein